MTVHFFLRSFLSAQPETQSEFHHSSKLTRLALLARLFLCTQNDLHPQSLYVKRTEHPAQATGRTTWKRYHRGVMTEMANKRSQQAVVTCEMPQSLQTIF